MDSRNGSAIATPAARSKRRLERGLRRDAKGPMVFRWALRLIGPQLASSGFRSLAETTIIWSEKTRFAPVLRSRFERRSSSPWLDQGLPRSPADRKNARAHRWR